MFKVTETLYVEGRREGKSAKNNLKRARFKSLILRH